MDNINITISGINIRIEFKECRFPQLKKRFKSEIKQILKDYVQSKIHNRLDYTIEISDIYTSKKAQLAIKDYRYLAFYRSKSKKKIQTYYQVSRFQFITILNNLIFYSLTTQGGFFLHSSSATIDDKAYIFVGKAGAGKSTSVKLLHGLFSILTEDLTIISAEKSKYYCYKNPIDPKKIDENKFTENFNGFKIDKIFFLKKSKDISVHKIEDKETAIKLLTKQIINPNKISVANAVNFSSKFNEFYYLYFPKSKKTVQSFFKKLAGSKN